MAIAELPYMNAVIQEKLNLIKSSVLEIVPETEAIYIFGSYVNGIPHKDSDLDICVVIPDNFPDSPADVSMEIRKSLYKTLRMTMDLFVKKADTFHHRKQSATLEKVITQDGVMIYGNR